jgi:hypothetical protein
VTAKLEEGTTLAKAELEAYKKEAEAKYSALDSKALKRIGELQEESGMWRDLYGQQTEREAPFVKKVKDMLNSEIKLFGDLSGKRKAFLEDIKHPKLRLRAGPSRCLRASPRNNLLLTSRMKKMSLWINW